MSEMGDTTEAKKPEAGRALANGKAAAWWTKEIAKSNKDWKPARDRGRKVIDRYRDERENAEDEKKRFNILFSNVETLKPAVYSQTPTPDIRRRFQDKDPVGRMAATILQRAVSYCLESYDFNGILKRCNHDYLLPGFAVARVVYKPYLSGEGEQQQKVYEEVGTKYVPWDMFAMSRSKVYENVWWAAAGEDLTKDEAALQFGEKVAAELNYGRREEGEDRDGETDGKVRVWEVWCKRDRSRFVVAEGYQEFVRKPESDPLRLENFYPWPKPLWSVLSNDTLKPTPEYTLYQDQALELDDLTDRIDILTSAVRRRGAYDAAFKEMLGMLTGKTDNQFVPVNDWAAFQAKGGLDKIAAEMALDDLIKAIVALENRREIVKQTIYEVTGIADIVRGASNPNETLGAQQLKGRWAGLRISTRQQEFAGFARDIVRLKAEIIAERFDQETLGLMAGVELPTAQSKMAFQQMQAQAQQAMQRYQAVAQQAQQAGQPPPPPPPIQPPSPEELKFYQLPTWEDVIKVLRDDKLRGFKIDIETDSTVMPDAEAEQKARTDFVVAVGNSAQQLGAAVQMGFMDMNVARELWQFGLRAFKSSPGLEEALDAPQDQPGGMSPQQVQAQQKQMQDQQQVMAKQAQDLAKRESAAKDAEHQAALRSKDIEKQSSDLASERKLFALEQKMKTEIEAVVEGHARQIQALGAQAEDVVREIVGSLPHGAAAPPTPGAEGGAPAEKAPRSGGGSTTLHLHMAAAGGEKRPPRKFRIADSADGSSTIEEMVDSAAPAESGGQG
jgi:type II secretory pathway pseudopilin PulG